MSERRFWEDLSMGKDDKRFLVEMGKRIAARRKACGMTQARLAEILGFSQPHIQAFESGRRRISVTDLPKLADAIGASVEELLGLETKRGRRGRPSKLERQFEELSKLPPAKRRFVSEMLDTVLGQAS